MRSARASGSITSNPRLLSSGTLQRYVQELSITGLTSNPTIFDHAIKNSHDYDEHQPENKGRQSGELSSLNWRSRTCGRPPISSSRFTSRQMVWMAGYLWRSHPCWLATRPAPSPRPRICTPARDGPICSSRSRTSEGLPAIEEAIFAGVPVNVTLLFSGAQYVAAAEAYLRGIERRIAAGLIPMSVPCFAVRQPLGCRGRGQSARGLAQQAWDRHRRRGLISATALCLTRSGRSAS